MALHPGTFQLEQVGGFAGAQHFVSSRVLQRQFDQVDADAPFRLQQLDGAVQDGQVGQPQKVHLEQAQLGHRIHGVLGHHHRAVPVAPRRALQRDDVGQGLVADQHAGGVGAYVVHGAFQRPGVLQQPARVLALLAGPLHFRVGGQGFGQGARLGRRHFGDAVHVAVAHPQTPAHVPQGALGSHGAEGDDVRHPVAAVAVDDVAQDFVPPVVLEVHVDVRHFLALQVEEALEHQFVPHGVDVGDAQAVQGHAGRRAAPHPEQDALPPHEGNDVPHHQEVVGETGSAAPPPARNPGGRGPPVPPPSAPYRRPNPSRHSVSR